MTFNATLSALYIVVGTFGPLVTFVGKYIPQSSQSEPQADSARTLRMRLLLLDSSWPACTPL